MAAVIVDPSLAGRYAAAATTLGPERTSTATSRQPSVLVVVSGWPRVSETFAVNELLALHAAGMLAGIAATKPGDDALVQPGLDQLAPLVTLLPEGDAGEQADALVGLVAELAAHGRSVDALHGYFAHRPAEVAATAATRLGVPYGFSVHALDLRKVAASELQRRAERAAIVVTCNTDAADALAASGVAAQLLPHGVDLARFTQGGARAASERDELRLLAVGRLVEKKGFATLIDAVSLLPELALRVEIVGDGPDRERLTAQIEQRCVGDRIMLVGRCTHAELPDRYRGADLVVVPSIVDRNGDRDGLPNVVLEAMACGRAVIASDVAAIGTAIRQRNDGATGLLVPPGDPRALADAIRALATDPLRRAALGRAARRLAEDEFDLAHCSERFCGALATALSPATIGAGA